MLDRLQLLIGEEGIQKLRSSHVLVIGCGGVGGYVLEVLARCGIGEMTVFDYDQIEVSNLNRQILAHTENIGKSKVFEAEKRVKQIFPAIRFHAQCVKLTPEMVAKMDFQIYDYLIDACDDVSVKAKLIQVAHEQGVPILSCMGTGNRMHPELFCITPLKKTEMDPLARKLRFYLRKVDERLLNTPVLWSKEAVVLHGKVGSMCAVVMSAGAHVAGFVIQELLKKNDLV